MPGCKSPILLIPDPSLGLTTITGWDTGTFFSYYTMVFLCPILYVSWKLIKKTKIVKPEEADLVWERPAIDAYEANTLEKHLGFWEEVGIMMGLRKKKEEEEHIE